MASFQIDVYTKASYYFVVNFVFKIKHVTVWKAGLIAVVIIITCTVP